jgi:hypothetical protein
VGGGATREGATTHTVVPAPPANFLIELSMYTMSTWRLEHLECRLQPLPPGRFTKKLG